MGKGVRMPTNSNGGYKTFGGGHYGIFNNLPAPKFHDVGGHACMKMCDIITQRLCLPKILIELVMAFMVAKQCI